MQILAFLCACKRFSALRSIDLGLFSEKPINYNHHLNFRGRRSARPYLPVGVQVNWCCSSRRGSSPWSVPEVQKKRKEKRKKRERVALHQSEIKQSRCRVRARSLLGKSRNCGLLNTLVIDHSKAWRSHFFFPPFALDFFSPDAPAAACGFLNLLAQKVSVPLRPRSLVAASDLSCGSRAARAASLFPGCDWKASLDSRVNPALTPRARAA